jgi:cytidylate kinase
VSRGLVVSLDGPASSGKSSAGAGAAKRLGYRFLDTGVLYRGLAWLARDRDVGPEDIDGLLALIPRMAVVPDDAGQLRHIRVDGTDVTERLHSADVEATVSQVARQERVRAALLPVQHELAAGGRIIMAGRDIGTVVLPDADLKLYLHVSVEERARRRAEERGVAPSSAQGQELEADLQRRDMVDSTRAVAPLRIPDGAVLIGGDGHTLDETVAEIVEAVRAREAVLDRE